MPRRILEGKVVSNKADKTINVIVERRYMHPVYKKYIKSTDKYAAHDEANLCVEGDRVSIEECRPISKSKKWVVVTQNGNAIIAAPVTADKKVKEEKTTAKKAPVKKKSVAKKAVKK